MGAIETTILSIILMIALGYFIKRIDLISINDVDSLNNLRILTIYYIVFIFYYRYCFIFHFKKA